MSTRSYWIWTSVCVAMYLIISRFVPVHHKTIISKPHEKRLQTQLIRSPEPAHPKLPYNLSAVVLLRVFTQDKIKHTFREVREWMEWMFYGGVEHIFIYDNWHEKKESIFACLQQYIDRGLVTYHDFNHPGRPYPWVQSNAYAHWLENHRHESLWQMTLDFDEYPHLYDDVEAGFLLRLTSKSHCAIYFQNQFWLDVEQNKSEGQLLMERYLRRDKNFEKYPSRSKVMYKTAHVTKLLVHSVEMRGCNDNYIVPIEEGALEHYWGPRNIIGNPNFNLERFMKNTIGDLRMRNAASKFKIQHQPNIPHTDLQTSCALGGW